MRRRNVVLAVALVAGTVAGWPVACSTDQHVDAVTEPEPGAAATGEDGSSEDTQADAPVGLGMPEPGESPADEDMAHAEITELFSAYGGGDPHSEVDLHEEPAVWLDAALRFREQTPEYFEWAKEVYGVVHEIVFNAPDRATVRFSLVTDNPTIPAPGERIGWAVLIDGTWKASIESSCAGLALAGIECDYSLKE